MIYDRDLMQLRRIWGLLALANFVLMGYHSWHRNWTVGLTAGFWAACCLYMIRMFRYQQEIRDAAKSLRASLFPYRN